MCPTRGVAFTVGAGRMRASSKKERKRLNSGQWRQHMQQKRWSLSIPLDGFTLAEHIDLAREAERRGYSDSCSLEVAGLDFFPPLAVGAATTRMRVAPPLPMSTPAAPRRWP